MKAFFAKAWAGIKKFFSKAWKGTKTFFGKAWKWSVAHKAIAITTASVVVAGATCAIVLPIALHEHSYSTEWTTDATNHWHTATCKHEEEISDLAAHTYDNACDTTCNVCNAERTVEPHDYDNACDTTCNVCNAERTVEPHDYDNACDVDCNVCNAERTVEPHVYDNACDVDCNVCTATRTPAEHVYDNACDADCNVCTATRTPAEHVYDNACDADCNVCTATRTPAEHVYDNACDTDCNECGATRTITHDHADTLTAGETTHWYACSVCGDKKDEASHVFDKTVANSEYLKEAATATTKAQYYKSCECGAKSATEYFEIDKAPANLKVSEISKTYDGTPVAEPTVTFDGVGAENFAYYKGDEKLTERPTAAGTYKVVVTVDETETHAGDRVEREFTIVKRAIWAENVVFTYNGVNAFYGDEAVADVKFENAVSGEINPADIVFEFSGSGVGNTLTNIKFDDGIPYAQNYTFDLSKCAAKIVKRVIWTTGVTFAYGNCTAYTGEESPNIDAIVFQNVVAGETIAYDNVKWTFADVNVGAKLADVTLYPEADAVQANYEIDLSKCEAEIVKAKIAFSVKVNDKTYDGESIDFNDVKYTAYPIFVDLSTATIDFKLEDEGEDHYGMNNTPTNAGKYIVRVGISETENYESYIAYATFTISPKVINNVKFDFTYNGSDYQQVVLTSADHSDILGSDQVTLEVCFATPDVGSAVDTSSPEMAPAFNDDNYALGTYEFSIVPKALTGSLILDVYYGDVKKLADSDLYYYDQVITETEYGVLTGDSVTVRVLYANPNAGTADTSFAIYGESNYVIGDLSVNNSTISQKLVTELPATLEAEYSGTNSFVMNLEIDGMDATLTFDTEDTLTIGTFNRTIHNPSLGDNYLLDLSETTYEIKIVEKKLSHLDLRVTYDTYNNMYITLLTKDGIVAGEKVKLMMGHNYPTTLPVGTVLKLQQSMGALHGEDYEVIVSMLGDNKANYELVAYDDGNGNMIYGTMTIVASCEIQDDGNCACGGHITQLTLNSPQVVSDQGVTAGETTYFSFKGNNGIYRISDYVVGTASPWATITVSLENGTAVEPVREGEY
ncbi:MAG: hypothetical protein J6S04_04210, partial [Clostridia bacterium]|nr:hypothetical protein [Clostridia bacterium]